MGATAKDRRELAALVGGLLLLVVLVFDDFGVTWDETVELYQRHKGPRTLAFWQQLLTGAGVDPYNAPFDTGHNPFVWFVYYSLYSFWSAVGGAPAQIDAYHLFTALVSVVGVVFAYRVAATLLPHRWALVAAVLVAVSPRLLGHAFGNFKDIPFAVAWLAALDTLIRAVEAPSRRTVLWHGVAIGALLVQRIGGLLFAPLSLLGFVLVARRAADRAALLRWAASAMVLALGIHYLSYPYLLLHPIDGLVELFETQASFDWHGVTLTLGDPIGIERVPRWYAVVWLWVTTPEVTPVRARPSTSTVLLLLSALFPLAWITASRAPIYDGARHILFVVPPLTVAAVVGWHALHRRLAIDALRARIVPSVLVLAIVWLAVANARLHPYQAVWFNQTTGGLDGAAGRWTLDYWATTTAEVSAQLSDASEPRTLCVVGALENGFRLYLGDGWDVQDEDEAGICDPYVHYLFGYSRNRILEETAAFVTERPGRWEVAYRVERAGIPLAILWRNTRPLNATPRR